MANFTPNYNLKKPLRTEYYNVADANGNSDIVDAQLKAVNDRVDLVEGDVDALELGKVDKVTGKGLSTNDYTTTEKNKLAGIPADTAAQLSGKVDKVVGKQLSDENYTLIEKNKLAGVEENATADMTALEIKTEYESNADTNAYTDAEKAKVANLPADTNAQLANKVPQTRTVNGKALSIDVSVTAADVPNTPAGGIAASTVQAAINELDTEKANKVQEAWITPTFINGASGSVKYMKDSFGFIHFKGAVIAPTGWSNSVFAMPVGYRLSATQFMFGRNEANAPTLVQFMKAANGVWVGSSASSVAVYLDGLHYLAEA